MVCDLLHRSNVEASSSSASFAIGRASDAPVAPPAMRRLGRSLFQRPTPENDAEIGGRRFREEYRRAATQRALGREVLLRQRDALRHPTASSYGTRPSDDELARFTRFCRRGDRALRPFESTGFHPAFLRRWWLPTPGSRSRPAVLSTEDASLSQTKPFDFCNEFSKYDARTRFCELDPCPPQGTALRALPLIVAPFGAARLILLDGRRCVPDVPQRAARDFPDIRARDPDPSSRNRSPFERRLLSGPEGHGMRADRTSSSKGEVAAPLRTATPCAGLRLEVPPRCSFEPLVSSAMRARRDGSPFACFYTSALPT